MADVAGQPRPDLSHLPTEPQTMGFFELLRRLERPDARFGRAGGPGREPARLGQRVRLSMATRDVASFRPGTGARPPEVDVEVLGLLGPEGALPLHMTRWVMARLSERWFAGEDDRATSDTTFLDFCNLLQHRMIALYWRAWGDARAEVQAELGSEGRVQALISRMAGIGLPGMQPDGPSATLAPLKRRHATALVNDVQSPERLTRLLADYLGVPVSLREFVGEWLPIPAPLQTQLGRDHARLGQGAVVGARTYQRQMRIALDIGPMDLRLYRRMLQDDGLRAGVAHAILFAIGRELDVDLRLVLARAAVPAPRLGACQLGRTAWLATSSRADAADKLCRSVTRPERMAAPVAPGQGVAA